VTALPGERLFIMSPTPALSVRTVALPVEFLAGLRQSALAAHESSGSPPAAAHPDEALRDAGYSAGQALFTHFGAWLEGQGEVAPGELADERFPALAEAYFHDIGWGRMRLEPLSEAVLALDVSEWGEALDASGGCPVTTGLFAGFFGRLAEAPLAVLEVDAPAPATGRARFLLGSVDVLAYVWEAMERGIPYDRAAASAG
jgi:hypothetical protein